MRVLLLDDHRIFRTGLRLVLERVPGLSVVGEAGDGATALELARDAAPDLLVADIHLGAENGIAIARQILDSYPAIKVIFLSSDSNFALVRQALDAGGSGYLLKENAAHDLIRAIEAAQQGGVYLCPEVAAALVRDFRRRDDAGPDGSAPPQLSEREREVLRLIAEGLRNKEIADRLRLSVKSVETYRRRLMHKLGYHSTAELVRYAIREGLLPG